MDEGSSTEPRTTPLVATGVGVILASVVVAVWTFGHGDYVTPLGSLLLAVAGLLMVGIGTSPDATVTHRVEES
jgi:uncharacterized membrane protein